MRVEKKTVRKVERMDVMMVVWMAE